MTKDTDPVKVKGACERKFTIGLVEKGELVEDKADIASPLAHQKVGCPVIIFLRDAVGEGIVIAEELAAIREDGHHGAIGVVDPHYHVTVGGEFFHLVDILLLEP